MVMMWKEFQRIFSLHFQLFVLAVPAASLSSSMSAAPKLPDDPHAKYLADLQNIADVVGLYDCVSLSDNKLVP